MKRIINKLIFASLALITSVSSCTCTKTEPDDTSFDKVLVVHMNGFNNLTQYMFSGYTSPEGEVVGDLPELKREWVPEKHDRLALLAVCHKTAGYADYATEVPVYLLRIYKGNKNTVVTDTVKAYPGARLAVKEDLKTIYTDIKNLYKTDHYGLLFSSHGTGWLPEGYFSYPEKYEGSGFMPMSVEHGTIAQDAVEYNSELWDNGIPVKSFGQSVFYDSNKKKNSYELDIKDMVEVIPFHSDYIIFDACLMGGIEVAYQFKDKTDLICFSQAEVLADGLQYSTIPSKLLRTDIPDVIGVARGYYEQHQAMSSWNKSATVSVIDCRKLDKITSVCAELFEKYRDSIASVSPSTVQGYFTGTKRWFYDLEDILIKSGISASEETMLKKALNECILYSGATKSFLMGDYGESYGGFYINHYCGLSMYLPIKSSKYLNNYYKTLEWNKATHLVD